MSRASDAVQWVHVEHVHDGTEKVLKEGGRAGSAFPFAA